MATDDKKNIEKPRNSTRILIAKLPDETRLHAYKELRTTLHYMDFVLVKAGKITGNKEYVGRIECVSAEFCIYRRQAFIPYDETTDTDDKDFK